MNLHVPDYLILPFGRAVKSDLQKIMLSAVSADGLYFSTEVPVIFIRKSARQPFCLGRFERHFGILPHACAFEDNNEQDQAVLDHMLTTLKSHNPSMTKSEERFLDLYFGTLKELAAAAAAGGFGAPSDRSSIRVMRDAQKQIGLPVQWVYDDGAPHGEPALQHVGERPRAAVSRCSNTRCAEGQTYSITSSARAP
jgi:hypothetical protein